MSRREKSKIRLEHLHREFEFEIVAVFFTVASLVLVIVSTLFLIIIHGEFGELGIIILKALVIFAVVLAASAYLRSLLKRVRDALTDASVEITYK